jgi:hypothetical protein
MTSENSSIHDQEQLLRQYEILRDELVIADAQNYKVTAGVFTACSVILLTGFQQLDKIGDNFIQYWLCLAIFGASIAVSIPGYRILIGNRKRVWRIATYMEIFLEPFLSQVKWETRVQKLRDVEKADTVSKFTGAKNRSSKPFGIGILTSSDIIANEILLMAFFGIIACIGLIISILGICEWIAVAASSSKPDLPANLNIKDARLWIILILSLILGLTIINKARKDIKSESRTGITREKMRDYWQSVKDAEGQSTSRR